MNKIKEYFGRIWWYFHPYVEINVKWPKGPIAVEYGDSRWYDCGATWVQIDSADPNDHYRPFMEEWIGRQGIDWAWYLGDTDSRDNRLTIRLQKKYEVYASHIAIMWN